jgi:Recombinase
MHQAPVVFEPEASIVRRIFNMYADGLSLKAIAAKLNAEGLAFPRKGTRRAGAPRLGRVHDPHHPGE